MKASRATELRLGSNSLVRSFTAGRGAQGLVDFKGKAPEKSLGSFEAWRKKLWLEPPAKMNPDEDRTDGRLSA